MYITQISSISQKEDVVLKITGTARKRWTALRALLVTCCVPPPDNLNNLLDPHTAREDRCLTLPIADFTARSTPGGGEMSDQKDHIIGVLRHRTAGEGTTATSLLHGHHLNSYGVHPRPTLYFLKHIMSRPNTGTTIIRIRHCRFGRMYGTGLACECACACAFVREDSRERRRPHHACACSICVRLRHFVRLQSVPKLNRPPSAFLLPV
ncbi:unnamed protein product [Leptosia nina]|uniref:Uncharacterized protein n=1 Tax=Leptosia nina TaxID=320188 RepID=A0AAV1J631_9NEOP